MIRIMTFSGAAAATAETALGKMTVPTGVTRTLRELRITGGAGVNVRLFNQQDMIVEVDSAVAVNNAVPVPVDAKLSTGAELTISALNTTAAPVAVVVVLVFDEA